MSGLNTKFSDTTPKDLPTKPHGWHLAPIPRGQPAAENGAYGGNEGRRRDISEDLQLGQITI